MRGWGIFVSWKLLLLIYCLFVMAHYFHCELGNHYIYCGLSITSSKCCEMTPRMSIFIFCELWNIIFIYLHISKIPPSLPCLRYQTIVILAYRCIPDEFRWTEHITHVNVIKYLKPIISLQSTQTTEIYRLLIKSVDEWKLKILLN